MCRLKGDRLTYRVLIDMLRKAGLTEKMEAMQAAVASLFSSDSRDGEDLDAMIELATQGLIGPVSSDSRVVSR